MRNIFVLMLLPWVLLGCSQSTAPAASAPADSVTPAAEATPAVEDSAADEPADDEHGQADDSHSHAEDDHDHEHAEDDHDHDHDHVHEPKRGGMLVELGDHAANFEVLFETETGKLTFYAMDAHVENPVRLTASEIAISVDLRDGNPPLAISLAARENALTGETVGDTSEFVATDERLKGISAFEVTVPKVEMRGITFENVTFDYPQSVE